MKVAIDARGASLFHGTGIGTYTDNLITSMLDINSNDKFTLFCSGKFNKTFNRDNSNIIFSSGKHGSFYEKYFFPKYLNDNSIDLYHIPQNGIGFELNSNIKTVVTIHDLIPYIMPETVGKSYLQRFLRDMPDIISNASGIITVSEYSKNDILKFFSFYPKDKIYVTPLAASDIYKPIDKSFCTDFIKSKYNITNPYVLYIGGFSSRKNAKGLIDAYTKVYKSLNKHYNLVLAGSIKDEGEKLRKFINENNLENQVIFTGYIEDDILPILYSGCDAFVYPSFYEGFGLPPLEAMSCKAPVITSKLTSIPEVTLNNALLINPYSNSELENALITLLNNETLKHELSEKGYSQSKQFTWKKTAEKTIEAYSKISSEL